MIVCLSSKKSRIRDWTVVFILSLTHSCTHSASKSSEPIKAEDLGMDAPATPGESSVKTATSTSELVEKTMKPYKIAGKAVTARKGPGPKYGKAGSFKKGATVQVLGTEGDWKQIGPKTWVRSSDLEP